MRDDRDDRDAVRRPPFPVVVKIAGICWIVLGSIIPVHSLIVLLVQVVRPAAPGGAPQGAILTGAGCLLIVVGLIAAAFIFVGVQSVRGTAPGTVGNGVGSILFGLLNFIPVAQQIAVGGYLHAGLSVLYVLGLITAGILALVGTADYQAWRRSRKSRRRRLEDDEDDRPRRRRREDDYDDNDYDRSRRRRDAEEDEYDDEPPRRRRRVDDDDDEDDRERVRRPSRDE
jgi:hypothetical protein